MIRKALWTSAAAGCRRAASAIAQAVCNHRTYFQLLVDTEVRHPEAQDQLRVIHYRATSVVGGFERNEDRVLVSLQHVGRQLVPLAALAADRVRVAWLDEARASDEPTPI